MSSSLNLFNPQFKQLDKKTQKMFQDMLTNLINESYNKVNIIGTSLSSDKIKKKEILVEKKYNTKGKMLSYLNTRYKINNKTPIKIIINGKIYSGPTPFPSKINNINVIFTTEFKEYKLNPITEIKYLHQDALLDHFNNFENHIFDGIKLFTVLSLANDIKNLNKIKQKLHSYNLKLPDYFDNMPSYSDPITLKGYAQLFLIEIYKQKLVENERVNSIISELKISCNEYLKRNNHIHYISNELSKKIDGIIDKQFSETLQNISKSAIEESQRTAIPEPKSLINTYVYRQPIFAAVGGGPMQQGFKHIKKLLEVAAEPRHDFGGARSHAASRFSSSYRGFYHGFREKDSPELKQTYIAIDNLLSNKEGTPGVIKKKTFWQKLLQLKNPLKINTMLSAGSDFEANMFTKLKGSRNLAIQNDNFYFGRFHYFSFLSNESDELVVKNMIRIFNMNQEGDIFDVTLKTDFYDYLKSVIVNSGVEYYVFDSSLQNQKISAIQDRLKKSDENDANDKEIKHIVPLVNIWDPASSSVVNFHKSVDRINEPNGDYIKRTYMEQKSEQQIDDNDDNWFPRTSEKNTGADHTFTVNYSGDENVDEPVRFNINGTGTPINLSSGFSVAELSALIDYTQKLENTSINQDDINKLTDDVLGNNYGLERTKFQKMKALYNLFKGINKKDVIKILLDMKKTGDWSQIKYVAEFNKDTDIQGKAMNISNDKLFCLFSILNLNPTLFASTRKYTNQVFNEEDHPILLGFFSGKEKSYTNAMKDKELEHIRKLIPEIFNEDNLISVENIQELVYDQTIFENLEDFLTYTPGDFNDEIDLKGVELLTNDARIPENLQDESLLDIFFGDNEGNNKGGLFRDIYNDIKDEVIGERPTKTTMQFIKRGLECLRLIINILTGVNQLLSTNVTSIEFSLNNIEKYILKNVSEAVFENSQQLKRKIESIRTTDLNRVFQGNEGLNAGAASERRSRRLVSKIEEFKKDFDWFVGDSSAVLNEHPEDNNGFNHSDEPDKVYTPEEYNTNCNWYTGENRKIKDNIVEVSNVVGQIIKKIMDFTRTSFIYTKTPVIYSTIIDQIVRLAEITGTEDFKVNYGKNPYQFTPYLIYHIRKQFCKKGAGGFNSRDFELQATNRPPEAGEGSVRTSERFSQGFSQDITVKINNAMSFLSCLYQKLYSSNSHNPNLDEINKMFSNLNSLSGFLKNVLPSRGT